MTIEQIEKLINRLLDLTSWALANEWETPIDLSDNLQLAIAAIEELKEIKEGA